MIAKNWKNFALSFVGVLVLGACTMEDVTHPYRVIESYLPSQKKEESPAMVAAKVVSVPVVAPAIIALTVEHIDVDYMPNPRVLPVGQEYTSHLSPVAPVEAVSRLINTLFVPTGGNFAGRVAINEASIIKVPLAPKDSFLGWFEAKRDERYDLTLDVTVEVLDPRGYVVAATNSHVTQSKMSPNLTLTEQEDLLKELLDNGLAILRQELRKGSGEYLGLFIDNPATN